jgi:peptidoglycan/xylan/chitin deacetylase (PgdA/CDA1 family)
MAVAEILRSWRAFTADQFFAGALDRSSMDSVSENRAASALFRVCGKAERWDAAERAESSGMHRGERWFLAVWVSASLAVAVGEGLVRALGPWWGGALVLPVTFFAVNVLPFLIGGATSVAQWRRWLGVFVAWAIWRHDAGGVVGAVAWSWLGIFALNAVALGVIGWKRSMRWTGRKGIVWRMALLIGLHVMAVAIGFFAGWNWALVTGALIATGICWAILCPSSQVLGSMRTRTGDGRILITIDDGPDPRDTPVLLDLLDAFQAKAVFFVIGEKVRAHPELAREIVRRGHELGNHTLSHPAATFWCAGPKCTRREIEGGSRAIEEATGVKPRWFRAPVGHRNLFTHPIAGELGMEVVAWRRRGFDAVERDVEKVLRRILPVTPGDIVLVHESTPTAEEVLRGVLEGAKGVEA